MTISAGTVFINVAANIGPFRTQMLGLGSTVSKVGSNISRVGTGISRAITVPLGFAAIAATKLAVDYDSAFRKIAAVSTASASDVKKWREQVLQLAGKTAQAPEELAEALYFLASAGLKPTQVFPALVASAKASAIGLGETADVAKITAQVLNAYADSGLTAVDVTNTLVEAVKRGTAEPSEFATALGRILPIASKTGIEFNNLAASLAVVSNIGLDVNEGVTAMRGLLNSLVSPGAQAEETLKKIGLTSVELRDIISEKGLLGTIRELQDLTEKTFGKKASIDALDKIIPNIRALTGALGLTQQEAKAVDDIFRDMTDSVGETDKAFEKTAKGPAFKFQQMLAKLKVTGIEIGQQLLPILLDIADAITKWVTAFKGLDEDTQRRIIEIGLALIALGPVIRIIGGLTTAFSGLFAVMRGIVGLGGKVAGAITGATAAAQGAQQLTLFGPGAGAAAGSVSLAGPVAAGLALVAAAAVALKISYDNANERIDRNVELMRQGQVSASDFTARNAELTRQINNQNGAWRENIVVSRGTAVQVNAWTQQQADNAEAVKRFTDGVRDMAKSFGVSGTAVSDLASIFKHSQGTNEKYRHTIAAMVGGLQMMGGKLRDVTVHQLRNLLAMGDTGAAMRLLNREINEQTKGWSKNQNETAKNAREAANVDRAMHIAANSGRSLKDVLKDLENNSKGSKTELKDLNEKLKETGKQKPKPKVTVDASAAQTTLQGLRTQLETLTSKKWTANVNVTTTGGSTGFHLLQMLEERLEEITEKPWKTNVEVTAEDSSIRAIQGFANEATKGLEKVKQVVQQVFGEDFPKAYQDDLKAFKEASTEKLKTFEKDLKSYTKIFDKLKDKVNSFKDAIRGAFADASTLIGGALEELAKTTTMTGPEGEDIEVATPGDISSYLGDQIAQAKSFALKLAQLASSGLAPALLAELAGQGIAALPLVDALLAGGTSLIDEFNKANQTIKKFSEVTANALGEEYFGGAIKKVRNKLEDLANGIDNFANRIGRNIEEFVNSLQARRVGQEIESLIQSLNRSFRQLGVNVPHAAAGGIVRKKTLLVAGEAGPEAIVPLGKAGAMGGDIYVNVDVRGNAIYSQDLADEVRSILLKDKRFKGALGLA